MRYETTTTLAPEAVLAAAEQFFSDNVGLAVQHHGPQDIGFVGGGGHVFITVTGTHPTTLEIETREWDTPVTQFMGHLPR